VSALDLWWSRRDLPSDSMLMALSTVRVVGVAVECKATSSGAAASTLQLRLSTHCIALAHEASEAVAEALPTPTAAQSIEVVCNCTAGDEAMQRREIARRRILLPAAQRDAPFEAVVAGHSTTCYRCGAMPMWCSPTPAAHKNHSNANLNDTTTQSRC